MNKQEKTAAIETLAASVAQATNAIILDYTGLSVPLVTELRRQIREADSQYLVVKNTLALRAIRETPLEQLSDQFVGPVGVAYNSGDAVALAKAITGFQKANPTVTFKFKAVMVEGRVVPADQIKAISELPSREALVAKMLFIMSSPLTRLVRVLNSPIQNFVSALSQIADQKSKQA